MRVCILRARELVRDQPAILVGSLVEVQHSLRAQIREILPELLQFFLREHIRSLLEVGTPGHGAASQRIPLCSPESYNKKTA
jgi:hypothetical protein